jgi:acetamidase/formamidase
VKGGLSAEYAHRTHYQAHCLYRAAVGLKRSEVMDALNWIGSAYLPLSIFTEKGQKAPDL